MDLTANWVILAAPADKPSASILSSYIGLLTEGGAAPRIMDASSSEESGPIIVLNNLNGSNNDSGFGWRFGKERIEILGNSSRGLWNGIFDFLDALGVKWPEPGKEELPASSRAVQLARTNANQSAVSAQNRKRFFIKENVGAKERESAVAWAARNKYDAVVFPSSDRKFWALAERGRTIYGIDKYALLPEASFDISWLLPRRLFAFNRDLFRMEEGKRKGDIHFCPTNPETSARIKIEAKGLFSKTGGMAEPKVFHLMPEAKNSWCSCPACRAFSREEQYLISVNIAADTLAGLFPGALLSYQKLVTESEQPDGKITPRKNTFIFSDGTSKQDAAN